MNNPFLSTLPNAGLSQILVSLGPCTGLAAHTHPRATEVVFQLTGTIDVGFVEELANGHNLINATLSPGETVHFPQGTLGNLRLASQQWLRALTLNIVCLQVCCRH